MIDLMEGESIQEIKRRHPIILLVELIFLVIVFIGLITAAFAIFFIPFSFPEIITNILPFLLDIEPKFIILYLISILMLLIWQAIFVIFIIYYLDCWVVTNERTIHTELKTIFSRVVSSISHDKIQDITVRVDGFFPTFIKYGDLHIQTAGAFNKFIFKQIPDPYKTKELILKAQRDSLKKDRAI